MKKKTIGTIGAHSTFAILHQIAQRIKPALMSSLLRELEYLSVSSQM